MGVATEQPRPTMTVDEAANLLGVSRSSAFEAVKRGDIPSIRIGRRIVISRAKLMAMIDGETRPAA